MAGALISVRGWSGTAPDTAGNQQIGSLFFLYARRPCIACQNRLAGFFPFLRMYRSGTKAGTAAPGSLVNLREDRKCIEFQINPYGSGWSGCY